MQRSSKRIKTELVTETTVQSLRCNKYTCLDILERERKRKYFFYRLLFEQIFLILSMTEMKGNFYSNFTNNLGFAILAFYDKKLVKLD